MKKIFTSMAVAVAAFFGINADAQSPELYLRGSMPGWNTENCTDTYKFTTSDGENYSLSLDKLEGEFKIATIDWAQYNYGSVKNIELGTEYTMVNDGNSGNMSLKESSATDVTIDINIASSTIKISGNSGVFEYPDLWVVGLFNGWDDGFTDEYKMNRNDNVYTLSLATLPAGIFKIAAAGYAPNFGADAAAPDLIAGELFTCADNGVDINNVADINNALITFTFNREEACTLLITTDEGVAGVEIEEGDAEYYSIDGVRVANPEKGLYIKKSNGKISKVVL